MHAYPLRVSFRKLAFTRQAAVRDSADRLLLYMKQKAFSLKERVMVFSDEAQTLQAYSIVADRVIDISGVHAITTAGGAAVGSVKRHGMRSIWRAHYDVMHGGTIAFTIREANPWVKVIDGLMGEIPIVGLFAGYVFHPAYVVARPDGAAVLRVEKQPALFEGRFEVTREGALTDPEEELAVLGVLVMLLHERRRG